MNPEDEKRFTKALILSTKFYQVSGKYELPIAFAAALLFSKFIKLKMMENIQPRHRNEMEVEFQSLETMVDDMVNEELARKMEGVKRE